MRSYAPRLLKAALRTRSFLFLDSLIDLVTPPIMNLVGVTGGMILLSGLLLAAGAGGGKLFLLLWCAVGTLAAVHVIVGLYATGAEASLYRCLLSAPRYLVWKLGLYARLAFRRGTRHWVRTTRESHDLAR